MDLHFEEHNNQSLKRFEKMLKTDAVFFFDSAEFEHIIQYYIDSGKVNLAKKAIALGLEQHPETTGLHLLRAELLIIENDLNSALIILNEVASLEPNNEEVYIQKAALYSKQDKHTTAIELLQNALSISEEENDIDILSMIGMEYLYLEEFEKALLYFRNCIEINPEDQTTLYNIVYCFDILEKSTEAITYLEAHLENIPFSETAWHQLGRQYFKIKKYEKALEAFNYAIIIDENFVGAYIEKAKVLEKQGNYKEAIENYFITTEIEDPTAYAYLRIASCFKKLNTPIEAEKFYLKAYEQDPSLAKAIIALVDLAYNSKEYEKALFYIDKLINLDDQNASYWQIYAESNSKLGFYEESAKALKKCLTLNDNSLEIYLALSDSYYFMGDYQNAMTTLIKAETYYHRYPEIEYRLSGLYFLSKNILFGKKHLEKALELSYQKYRIFLKLFPMLENERTIDDIIQKYNY